MEKIKEREVWVDGVKGIACILVVCGHFFQSMVKAGIYPESSLYLWFNRTVYCFHVPLFFICSGYLYQKCSRVEDFDRWKTHVLKKALALGIPYFTFSTVTWILKTLFSGSVNEEIGGLPATLFLMPTSPYWYLYCLFFVFLITPTFKTRGIAIGFTAMAWAFKAISLFWGGSSIYAVSSVFSNEIWFVGGMCLCLIDIREKISEKAGGVSAIMGVLFFALSIFVFMKDIGSASMDFLLGMIACAAILIGFISLYTNRKKNRVFVIAKFSFPIFLMHTLFAAPIRIILMKAGIMNPIVHTFMGIGLSFVGPIIAAEIMQEVGHLDFLLYPSRYVKRGRRRKGYE